MRLFIALLLTACLTSNAVSQSKIDKTLEKLNSNSVPYISVDELKHTENHIILDTRTKKEFQVSHLKNALWVGHKKFQIDALNKYVTDKNKPIVVYCSIGVRSENIGEKLLKAGYTNVQNLYGGIFEWKNKGNPVYDHEGNKTEKVHAYSKHWGKLLTKGDKIYQPKPEELDTKHE